jgi:hypothetical protein
MIVARDMKAEGSDGVGSVSVSDDVGDGYDIVRVLDR